MVVEFRVSVLLLRKYFFRSMFWRCFSAAAVYCFCTSADRSRGCGTMLCVIVMSAPIVVNGQLTYVGEVVDVFGWKE